MATDNWEVRWDLLYDTGYLLLQDIGTLGLLVEYREFVGIGTEMDRRPICLLEAAWRQVECVHSEEHGPIITSHLLIFNMFV